MSNKYLIYNSESVKVSHRAILIELLDWIVNLCEINNLSYFIVGGTLLGAVRHKGFIPWDDDIDISLPRNDYETLIEFISKLNHSEYFLHNSSTDKEFNFLFTQINKNHTYVKANPFFSKHKHHGIRIDIFPLDKSRNPNSISSKINSFMIRQILMGILTYRSHNYLRTYLYSRYSKELFKGTIKLILLIITSIVPRKAILMFANALCRRLEKTNEEFLINYTGPYSHFEETNLYSDYFPPIKLEFEGKTYSAPNNFDAILKRLYGEYMVLPELEKRSGHSLSFIYIEHKVSHDK